MGFRPYTEVKNSLIACLPVSTTDGTVGSTDIDKLVYATSNHAGLAVGTTADDHVYLGTVAAVPTNTTAGSTTPFYVRPIVRGLAYEADFSTTYSTVLPASTDVGKFVGFGNTTTIAGASLSMGTLRNDPGSTSGAFFKITKVNSSLTARRVVVGVFNSSHLAPGV